jgi:hypothetical protein
MADAIEQGLASWDDDRREWFLAVPVGHETDRDRSPPVLSRVAERLSEASMIGKQHGEQARAWIARRIQELDAAGDVAGVNRFREIAAAYEQLHSPWH